MRIIIQTILIIFSILEIIFWVISRWLSSNIRLSDLSNLSYLSLDLSTHLIICWELLLAAKLACVPDKWYFRFADRFHVEFIAVVVKRIHVYRFAVVGIVQGIQSSVIVCFIGNVEGQVGEFVGFSYGELDCELVDLDLPE